MNSYNGLVVCTVLKSGGVYDARYVAYLANGVARNLRVPYRFVVLTDLPDEDFGPNVHDVRQLRLGLPGWWSKVELHAPDFYDGCQILFFDLDTIILGSLDAIAVHQHKYTILEDFYLEGHAGSGVMAWQQSGDRAFYDTFTRDPGAVIRNTTRGDQEWLERVMPNMERFQHLFPGDFVSFKRDCRRGNTIVIPPNAKVLCFHGVPKPHELLQHNIIKENWR